MTLSTDTIIGLISGILLTIIPIWAGYLARRPKLEYTGGGTGGISIPNKDIMATTATIYNHPFFFGFRVRRGPATITSARIYDPELKEYVGPVLMWSKDGSYELEREVTIDSGKQRSIYLFAKERYSDEYFIFSAERLNQELPRLPDRYKEKKKEFSLVLFDDDGRRHKFDLVVRNGDQSVDAMAKFTKLKRRLYHLREALQHLRQVFWPM